MPKRAVTPPPADDEPKYLTVVHPYPLHAHMELPKDREDFGRWLACCIGPDPFYAFFYKPSALNMVIIEIKRDYDGFDRLLGEHRWKEFLKNPSEEEMEKVTKVFYCLYSSGRQVQKNGWKRVDAQGSWFRNWSPYNDIIKFPYPETHYCDLVSEDQTKHPLCRPLPVRDFPQLQAISQPVSRPAPPGSAGWIREKSTSKPAPNRNAWKKGLPTSVQIPGDTSGKNPNSGKTNSSPANSKTPNNDTSSPWSLAATSPASTVMGSAGPNPWNRGPISPASSSVEPPTSPTRFQSNLHLANGVSDASSSSAPTTTTFCAPSVPPGLDPIPSEPPMPLSWADDIPEGLFSNLPDLPDLVIHNAPSTLPPIFSPNPQHPDTPDNMEEAFAEMGIADPGLGYPATWEYAESESQAKEPGCSADASESLWDDYEEPKPVVEELLCTDHGRICKRGICKTYAKQLREVEKAKKMKENPGGSRGKGRGKGRSGSTRGEDDKNWRRGSKGEVQGTERVRAATGWGNTTNKSKGTNIPQNASESVDDEDGSSVAASSKRNRRDSIESNPGSVASGWGQIVDSWG